MTTFFACSLLTMKRASERPCAASLPTTRENVGYLPWVNVMFVADEVMYGRPFRLKSGPTAMTSCEPAGPTVTSSDLFAANFVPTVSASFGLSWVSPCRIVKCVPFAALKLSTAYFAHVPCSWPRNATGPVSGPMNPIWPDVHAATRDAAIVGDDPFVTADAAAAVTPATISASTSAFFMLLFLLHHRSCPHSPSMPDRPTGERPRGPSFPHSRCFRGSASCTAVDGGRFPVRAEPLPRRCGTCRFPPGCRRLRRRYGCAPALCRAGSRRRTA